MWRLLPVLLFFTLAACARQAPLPDGAIQTGADLYMVPLEKRDGDGCQGYRQYSPVHMVTMAIYYRNDSGDFTANKLRADCYAKN
jgi:hypothetical protein